MAGSAFHVVLSCSAEPSTNVEGAVTRRPAKTMSAYPVDRFIPMDDLVCIGAFLPHAEFALKRPAVRTMGSAFHDLCLRRFHAFFYLPQKAAYTNKNG